MIFLVHDQIPNLVLWQMLTLWAPPPATHTPPDPGGWWVRPATAWRASGTAPWRKADKPLQIPAPKLAPNSRKQPTHTAEVVVDRVEWSPRTAWIRKTLRTVFVIGQTHSEHTAWRLRIHSAFYFITSQQLLRYVRCNKKKKHTNFKFKTLLSTQQKLWQTGSIVVSSSATRWDSPGQSHSHSPASAEVFHLLLLHGSTEAQTV